MPLLTAQAGQESQEPMRRMERDRERLRRGLSRVSITLDRATTVDEADTSEKEELDAGGKHKAAPPAASTKGRRLRNARNTMMHLSQDS